MKAHVPSGFQAAPIGGRIGFPGHSVTVIVKALYRLESDRISELLEGELAYPTGDIPISDDDRSEIKYESDFAHYKPRADLLLVGKCHPPGGQPAAYCPVTFRVGNQERTIYAFGDRLWDSASSRMPDPAPFTEMDLTWERAFGGAGFAANPAGRGLGSRDNDEVAPARALPNLEDPNQRISSIADTPIPAGFGPVRRSWEPRVSKAGTYDEHWQRTRWPWYAEDMDWSLFNAAPEPMQVDGYLRGDEEIYLENIHPEHPRFTTRLPGVRVRCFLSELPPDVAPPPRQAKGRAGWTPPPRDRMVFREVDLALDTLWIDAEEGLLALVWRGAAAVRDDEFREVQHLVIRRESLADPPADLAACRAEFWGVHDEEEGAAEAEPELGAELGPEVDAEAARDEEGGEGEEVEDEALKKLRADMERRGIDPDNPPEVTEEERERAKAFFREQGMDDVVALLELADEGEGEEEEEREEPWTRERVEARYADDANLEGVDLRRLDLSGLTLEGANLTGADLTGADLRDASLAGATMIGANLTDADLSGASLDGAQLSDAVLAKASLRGASLNGADLVGAGMEGADLSEAELEAAVLENAVLRGASLVGARATDAVLVHADLSGALLRDGVFDGVDFSGAVLDGVDARDASFASAELGGVRAIRAVFMGATMTELRAADALDLSGCNFSQIQAADSVWSGATLTEADFGYAELSGADFSGADLQRANLSAARLRGARFASAEMTGALLVRSDVFEGTFEKANLTGADLRGASLYAAELLEAQLHDVLLDGTNLNMTKYA
jgi:uncharacterized protein YjbI with pentapeptide repeats